MIEEAWKQTPAPNPEEFIHERLSQSPFKIKDWIVQRSHTHSKPNKKHPNSEIFKTKIAPGETIRHETYTDEPKVCVTRTQSITDSGQIEEVVITWTYTDREAYEQHQRAQDVEMKKDDQIIRDPQQILNEADSILARFPGIRVPRVTTSNSVLEGDPSSPLDPSVGEPGK
jgi:hypothetical protein